MKSLVIGRRPVEEPLQVRRLPSKLIQRKCACGDKGVGERCEGCAPKRLSLQRPAMPTSAPLCVPPIVGDVLRSPGEPLDRAARTFFEPRFGHDFSRVRVHAGAGAAESAKAVGASAYTVGANIVFGSGQFAPSTFTGRQLLAHELAHTIQQGGSGQVGTGNLEITAHDHPSEPQADQIARSVMNGSPSPHPVRVNPLIQRQKVLGEEPPPAKDTKPAFPVTGTGTCFCDEGDKSTSGKPMACGEECPNETDLFVAWPHTSAKCAKKTKEGKNVPAVHCKGQVKVSYGGNTVTATVKDCGPGGKGRIVDLSLAVVKKLDPSVKTCNGWGKNEVTVTQ
jgi:3D (Asp-Asp-Asp) domain-containing protein